nr:MAG TPA: tail protein [Caudoviricetes sp.]
MAIKAADQITLIDVTDAYSVMLTSEAYTFVGGVSGVSAGQTCSTEAVAYCGQNQCSSVTVDAKAITCPTGISATVENSGTAKAKITFTTTATVSTACEATIPVVVDGITVNKKFSFAVAKAGMNGQNGKNGTSVTITSKSVTYQVGTSGTTAPTGTWSPTVPAVENGKFLWTKTYVKYSDGNETTSYGVSYKGTNGTNGKDGAAGADAITLTITSSNGIVFKNNNGSTVLTAHVFKGGMEQTITDAGVCGSLGSIKWYKGTSTTAIKTAKTLTVSASDVKNSQPYSCQLE